MASVGLEFGRLSLSCLPLEGLLSVRGSKTYEHGPSAAGGLHLLILKLSPASLFSNLYPKRGWMAGWPVHAARARAPYW